MFLKKSAATINGKTYFNYKVVESYRENGKVKHRILFNIGHLTDEQASRLQLVISAYSNPDIVVSKMDNIVITKSALYLDVATLYALWQDWNLHNFFQQDRWISAMVANRCIDPVSKIGVKDWIAETTLPAYLDTDPLHTNSFDVYRELDRLTSQEDDLQSFLYQQLMQKYPDDTSTFFYDITSTYMVGKQSTLALFGHSRDNRPDCEQIVIALMVTAQGYPFYWKVLPGNTQDVTTVEDLVKNVKNRYQITDCMLVFDRGMVSSDNLHSLEDEKLSYVSAMDKDEVANAAFFKEALPDAATLEDWEQIMAMREFIPFDENEFLYFREFAEDERRYILAFDVARFIDEHKSYVSKINQIKEWIEKKNHSLSQAKKARSKDVLQKEIYRFLHRKHVHKWVTIQIAPYNNTVVSKSGKERVVESYQLTYEIDETNIGNIQRLYGITCFITNLSQETTPAREIIGWYRRKNKIEEAFHELKDHLDLRPVLLTREKRIKAHVTVCILAYLLYNDIEHRLAQVGISLSSEDALNILAKCQVNKMEFRETNKSQLTITEPTEVQRNIIKALGCERVIDPKKLKQVLKKMESFM